MKSQQVERRVSESKEYKLVWFILANLIVLVVGSILLVMLIKSHMERYVLSLSVDQIVGPIYLLLVPVVSSIFGLLSFCKGRRYVLSMQVSYYLLFWSSAFTVGSIFRLMKTPKYVDDEVGQVGGIISSYEAHLVVLLVSFGVGMLIYACGDIKIYRSIWKAIAGVCAVVGILLPSVLESHKVHWAEWKRLDRSYAERYEDLRFAISLGEFALDVSAAFVVLCIVSFILAPKLVYLSSNKVEIKKHSLWYDGRSLEFGGGENSVRNSVVHPGKDMSPIVKLGSVEAARTFDEDASNGGSSRSRRSRFRARDLFVLGLLLVCGR